MSEKSASIATPSPLHVVAPHRRGVHAIQPLDCLQQRPRTRCQSPTRPDATHRLEVLDSILGDVITMRRSVKFQLPDIPRLLSCLFCMACDVIPVNMRISLGKCVADPPAVYEFLVQQSPSVDSFGFLPTNELRTKKDVGDEYDNDGPDDSPDKSLGE